MAEQSAHDLAATVRAGLGDGCAFACGCDRPGDAAACIHADRFEALAALVKQAEDAQAEAERNYLDFGVRIQAATSRAVRAEEALRQAADANPWTAASDIAKKACERLGIAAAGADTEAGE